MSAIDQVPAGQNEPGIFLDALRDYRAGRLAEAGQHLGKLLAIDPRHAGSLHLLGMIAAQGGRYDLAIDLIGRATGLRPDDPDYHFHIAAAFHSIGKTQWAVTHYGRALALKPEYAEAHNNLGNILKDSGQLEAAASQYRQALGINSDCAEPHYNLGIVLAAQGRVDDAISHYERAIGLKPRYANAHHNLAAAFETKGDPDEAAMHYERALEINPDHPEAHNNLGNILKEHGRFTEAMTHFDRSIGIKPDCAEAHYNRAEIKTFHRADPDLAALEALARKVGVPPAKALHFHFALAKAYEDIGDHTRSFDHLRLGNQLKRGQINYDEVQVNELFQNLAGTFDRSLFDRLRGAGDSSSIPIFILGMPRSGSSLIEQILASHPQIQGGGERTDLEGAAASVFDTNDDALKYPECVRTLSNLTIRRLGESYLGRLPALADGKLRITDKLPGNFLHIGLIRMILPNARIIHTMRNPLDTCVSCYSKLFGSGVYFSYDLAELGRYYKRYRELMNHWWSVLAPDSILDVSYEQVVDDLEGQARRLIDYCGLPWDDRCLSFHQNKRPVATASSVQVRKPLFRSSLQRWRRFEKGLGPLLAELGVAA
jgi:tetratricopeptide (TPR) repeat protein